MSDVAGEANRSTLCSSADKNWCAEYNRRVGNSPNVVSSGILKDGGQNKPNACYIAKTVADAKDMQRTFRWIVDVLLLWVEWHTNDK